jgi:hypothetical protein
LHNFAPGRHLQAQAATFARRQLRQFGADWLFDG